MISDRRYGTVAEGLTIFAQDTLEHAPGYSSYGWNLISAVIEGASGEAFLHYMQHSVFEPLDMKATTADWTDSLIVGRVSFYEHDEGGDWVNAPYVDNSYKWAGGGFLSTTGDLLRFADAHMSGPYLDEVERQVLFTEQETTSGEGVDYGFGWSLFDDKDGDALVGHTGGSVGGITRLVLDPERRIAVVTFMNVSSADNSLGLRIMDLFQSAMDESP